MSDLESRCPEERLFSFEYTANFISLAKKAIEKKQTMELMYATYMMNMQRLEQWGYLVSTLPQCLQFSRCVQYMITSNQISIGNIHQIMMLWETVMLSTYDKHLREQVDLPVDLLDYSDETGPKESMIYFPTRHWGPGHHARVAQTLDGLIEALGMTADLFQISVGVEQRFQMPIMTDSVTIHRKAIAGLIHLQVFFENFLFQICRGDGERSQQKIFSARDAVCSIIDQILPLVSKCYRVDELLARAYDLSKGFPDSCHMASRGAFQAALHPDDDDQVLAASISSSLKIMRLVLTTDLNNDEPAKQFAFKEATALCYLSNSFTDSERPENWRSTSDRVIKRCLFWAGIVLCNSEYSRGLILQLPSRSRLTKLKHGIGFRFTSQSVVPVRR
jgi:hypothetical protein